MDLDLEELFTMIFNSEEMDCEFKHDCLSICDDGHSKLLQFMKIFKEKT